MKLMRRADVTSRIGQISLKEDPTNLAFSPICFNLRDLVLPRSYGVSMMFW